MPNTTARRVGNYLLYIAALTDERVDPTSADQFSVVDRDGVRHVYGDQSWVAYGQVLVDAHPGGRVQRRTVTITYGEWVDYG